MGPVLMGLILAACSATAHDQSTSTMADASKPNASTSEGTAPAPSDESVQPPASPVPRSTLPTVTSTKPTPSTAPANEPTRVELDVLPVASASGEVILAELLEVSTSMDGVLLEVDRLEWYETREDAEAAGLSTSPDQMLFIGNAEETSETFLIEETSEVAIYGTSATDQWFGLFSVTASEWVDVASGVSPYEVHWYTVGRSGLLAPYFLEIDGGVVQQATELYIP